MLLQPCMLLLLLLLLLLLRSIMRERWRPELTLQLFWQAVCPVLLPPAHWLLPQALSAAWRPAAQHHTGPWQHCWQQQQQQQRCYSLSLLLPPLPPPLPTGQNSAPRDRPLPQKCHFCHSQHQQQQQPPTPPHPQVLLLPLDLPSRGPQRGGLLLQT